MEGNRRPTKPEADPVAQNKSPQTAEDKLAETRRAQLQKTLDAFFYQESRDLFWRIFTAGHLADNRGHLNDRLRPLFSSGLIQKDPQTGHFSVNPQDVESAKAIYAAQIADKNLSSSQA
jgi:hypothetical protein